MGKSGPKPRDYSAILRTEDISIREAVASEYFENEERHIERFNRFNWLRTHPEDIPIDRENQQARLRGYDDMGVNALMAAVCLRALVDYQRAIGGKSYSEHNPSYMVEIECRMFFDSEMMDYFTDGMDYRAIEKAIKSMPENKRIANIWRRMEEEQVRESAKNATTIIEEQCDEQGS